MNQLSKRSRAEAPSVKAQQFLTFVVGSETYGFDLAKVHEIRAMSPITPLPGAPAYVKGVINLRGSVIPIMGLRERLRLPSAPYDRTTIVIVLSVGERIGGVVVDAVSDVIALTPDDIEPPPPELGLSDVAFFAGLGKLAGRLITLLEADALITDAVEAVPGDPDGETDELPEGEVTCSRS